MADANAPEVNVPNANVSNVPPDRRIEDRETSSARRPFADRTEVPSTELARSLIDLARGYAAAKGSSFASTHSLLVAILATGKHYPSDDHAAAWLWGALESHHAALEDAARALYPKGLDEPSALASGPKAQDMTSDLASVLDDAEGMARLNESKSLGARHLVGALLRPLEQNPTNATSMLERAGVDLDACRTAFFQALQSWKQGDPAEAWWQFLLGSARPLSGYMSDLVAGEDLIGITREVEAMASLVAAWSVEPPLSIGLFGEWGSGKSFFMQKMKERVREIARQARRSDKGQREFGYYKNVVQVEFNAWHYVEGNLWASLVEHIFQNLKVLGDTDAEEAEELKQAAARQEKLFEQLGRQQIVEQDARKREADLSAQQALKQREAEDLTRRQHAADQAAAAARAEALQKAEEKRQATAQDVLGTVYDSPEIKAELFKLLESLGIGRQQLATANDVRGAIDDALGSWATVREGWRIVAADRRGWVILVWVLAVPAGVALIGWTGALLFERAAGLIQWAVAPISTLTGLATSAVAAWKRYKPKLQPLLKTVDDLKAKRKELDARVETARKQRDEKVVALELEAEKRRNEAVAKTLEAQQLGVQAGRAAEQALETGRQIKELRTQIEALRPERRIATFIQERALAEDYRKLLGVPALIRRDFERLSRMFKTQRTAEADGRDGLDAAGQPLPERNDPTVVNRIVLYVDDLDRCPPRRVVEVLQAIHLLLAFPLFVVVVAVDARWVRRSLLDRFALMLSRQAATTNGAPRKGPETRTPVPALPGEGATPDDYLEKIFQIAFWLRPLSEATSKTLVQNLTKSDGPVVSSPPRAAESAKPAEGEQQKTAGSPPALGGQAAPSGAPSGAGVSSAAPVTGQRFEWTPVTAQPRTLHISDSEREYMEKLALLIGRSPRAVKRFLNSYRLIKAMLQPWELTPFVGSGQLGATDGLYHPTMLLLATVTGAPELGQMICSSLRQRTGDDFEAWLTSVAPHGRLDGYREWSTISAELRTIHRRYSASTLHTLRLAAERVDRFAFTPSRLPEREESSAPAGRKKSRTPSTPRPQ